MTNPVDLLFQRAPYAGGPVDLKFGATASAPETAPGDLVFRRPRYAGGPVNLVFGDTGEAPPVIPPVNLSLAATLPGPTLTATVQYQSRTQRPTVGQTSTSWQPARETDTGIAQGQQDTRAAPAGWAAFWQRTLSTPVSTQVVIPDTFTFAPVPHTARHQDASGLHTAARLINQSATRADQTRQGVFQNATPARHATAFRHQDADRSKRAALVLWWQNADQIARGYTSDFQPATALHPAWRGRYQEAQVPPPGRDPWPPVLPPLVTRVPSTDLLFACPPWLGGAVELLFGRVCGPVVPPGPGQTIVVPIREIYVTTNSVTLVRASDGAPIPTYSFSMNLDVDSWTWSWSASLQSIALSLITPTPNGDPIEVIATINGTAYRLCVEQYNQQRDFAKTRINVSGRGKSAILDAPYTPSLNYGNIVDRTAQQLMTDVLTINGVSIGWGLDFNLVDWLIPGNVWTHQGSYMSAITQIAAAAGGYVQPHNTASTLLILPRYPMAPWLWAAATPNFVLPSSVVSVEGVDWKRKANYNRVNVRGAISGVQGQITRAGTAGNVLAPMVTDPLITHADAARQRGIAILGDTGTQAHITLRLPVLAETGVITPGAMVSYVDGATTYKGIVRDTTVDWNNPTLRQVLTLETHQN